MTSNGKMAVIVRYPTEFGSHVKLCLAIGLGAFWYWFLTNVLRYVRYMLSAVGLLSVVCLSVVCDVGAPYSGG